MNKLIGILAISLVGSAAHAFTAPAPNKTTTAKLTNQIIAAAKKTVLYKQAAVTTGKKPALTVTYGNSGSTIPGFIGRGYETATVSFQNGAKLESRTYDLEESAKISKSGKVGKLKWNADPAGDWSSKFLTR